ncbi:MAG: type I glyceraldehyde-3-phosphate dehydrogenase [Deferrisomatales bacterium]|nr:type I glyceraldehyde-3-phosphate dehydrogenase [Deferrisomatales bacterium]
MAVRIAINGYGRIGRLVLRAAKKYKKNFDFVALHDLADIEALYMVTKYDSIHGRFPGSVELRDGRMVIDGDAMQVIKGAAKRSGDPLELPWADLGVDYVVESTGVFRRVSQLEGHLRSGAKRVILTVPSKDPLDATIVMGVNDHVIRPEHAIISNSSCTTNCAAPVAKVLLENWGIAKGYLSTVHAFTNDQRLFDYPHKDFRRARMATLSIIPTSTGAAKALGIVIPELDGRIEGLAFRVPVPTGSLIDLTVMLERKATAEEINEAMRAACRGPLQGIMDYTTDPIVSVDIIGDPHSAIVDAQLTHVRQDRMAKVVAWYDNEWGYACRVADLIEKLQVMDGIEGAGAL